LDIIYTNLNIATINVTMDNLSQILKTKERYESLNILNNVKMV